MQVFTKDILEICMLRIYVPRYWDMWGDWFSGIEKTIVLTDFVFLLVACNTDFSSYKCNEKFATVGLLPPYAPAKASALYFLSFSEQPQSFEQFFVL